MARRAAVKIARKPAQKPAAKKGKTGKPSKPAPSKKTARKQSAAPGKAGSKKDQILGLLSRKDGASLAELADATGWQAHSVRGFLSGTVKAKLGLDLTVTKDDAGERRYHVRAR